jgi:hypothetical protein
LQTARGRLACEFKTRHHSSRPRSIARVILPSFAMKLLRAQQFPPDKRGQPANQKAAG